MRFLPTRIHGVIDHLWSAALIASPWLFGFATGGAAQWTAVVFGLTALLYSLATDYELGAVRLIPMRGHLALDGIAGAALAASPWLFGFSREIVWPHLLFGLSSVIASLVSRSDARTRASWDTAAARRRAPWLSRPLCGSEAWSPACASSTSRGERGAHVGSPRVGWIPREV
jgi:hypothetical protein